MRKAAVLRDSQKSPQPHLTNSNKNISSWPKKKLLAIWYAVKDLLRNPKYAIPLLLNVTGSVWFFLLIGQAGMLLLFFFLFLSFSFFRLIPLLLLFLSSFLSAVAVSFELTITKNQKISLLDYKFLTKKLQLTDYFSGNLKTELSLTVPITNSLAFLFTVLGEWWADGKVISRGKLHTYLTLHTFHTFHT